MGRKKKYSWTRDGVQSSFSTHTQTRTTKQGQQYLLQIFSPVINQYAAFSWLLGTFITLLHDHQQV